MTDPTSRTFAALVCLTIAVLVGLMIASAIGGSPDVIGSTCAVDAVLDGFGQ